MRTQLVCANLLVVLVVFAVVLAAVVTTLDAAGRYFDGLPEYPPNSS